MVIFEQDTSDNFSQCQNKSKKDISFDYIIPVIVNRMYQFDIAKYF